MVILVERCLTPGSLLWRIEVASSSVSEGRNQIPCVLKIMIMWVMIMIRRACKIIIMMLSWLVRAGTTFLRWRWQWPDEPLPRREWRKTAAVRATVAASHDPAVSDAPMLEIWRSLDLVGKDISYINMLISWHMIHMALSLLVHSLTVQNWGFANRP